VKEELGEKKKARKVLQMRLVQEGQGKGKVQGRQMLPGVARKTEEAESKGVWGHPKEEVT
jgi:hypothetical protein